MTNATTRVSFGQTAAPRHRLGDMVRRILTGIGDGKPAPFVGFVWHRREDLGQTLQRQVEEVLRPVA
jgi:hypothetical protein